MIGAADGARYALLEEEDTDNREDAVDSDVAEVTREGSW